MSQINLRRRASGLFKSLIDNQVPTVKLKRNAGGWKRRVLEREAKKDIVFQYAGKKARRSDRIYVWGCSATGALGKYFCISYLIIYIHLCLGLLLFPLNSVVLIAALFC